LVDAAARYATQRPDEEIWIQHGNAQLPASVAGVAHIARVELLEKMRAADVVVTHGGSGSVLDAVSLGFRPVLVPRLARFGEAVNDHQLELMKALAAQERVIPVYELETLPAAIAVAREAGRSGPHATAGRLQAKLKIEVEYLASHKAKRTPLIWRMFRAVERIAPLRPLSER
jgi:UDP-N-acetylglucosamine transferase subunit ALG13